MSQIILFLLLSLAFSTEVQANEEDQNEAYRIDRMFGA
jgi:hypothetical protein